jgi:RNA polymerase sigma-70 factor (ECF subfamily)
MRSTRVTRSGRGFVLGWAGALAIALSGAPAQAADRLELEWQAPPECPAQDEVEDEVSTRLGETSAPQSRPTLRARGRVARDAQGYRLELQTEHGQRSLAARSCSELATAAALILALLIDPEANSAPAAAPSPAREPWLILRPELALDLGILPAIALGPGFAAGVRLGRTSLELSATYLPSQDVFRTERTSAVAAVSLVAAALGACHALTLAPELSPCLRVEYGRMLANARGLPNAADPSANWTALWAGARLSLKLTHRDRAAAVSSEVKRLPVSEPAQSGSKLLLDPRRRAAAAPEGGWREKVSLPDELVTETGRSGHSAGMSASRPEPASAVEPDSSVPGEPLAELTLPAVYEAHFDFVWRSARRLGASPAFLDDVVQEVFLVVHRRLAEFEQRSSLKSWLFGITRRVVRDQRRSAQRRPAEVLESEPADRAYGADQHLLLREQAELLHELLGSLDDDKREAFVLAELEQMSGPEIAEALQTNLNTVYARVRSARQEFEAALARHSARDSHPRSR